MASLILGNYGLTLNLKVTRHSAPRIDEAGCDQGAEHRHSCHGSKTATAGRTREFRWYRLQE
jgi:hypothetical protein